MAHADEGSGVRPVLMIFATTLVSAVRNDSEPTSRVA
jgi:hypothetical protein